MLIMADPKDRLPPAERAELSERATKATDEDENR